jgi:phage shock protein PspC (stress-responsive transcriptional regulator)
MTDTTSAPPADPGPPPPAPPGIPTTSERFFSWVRGLGIVRADGWLGGVAGGVAARLRIDPIIVRGIFVVVALVGFPALLVYAIAWALLPDIDGRIHLRELFHGRYDPAMTGVFIFAAVGFIPVVPWLRNVLLWPVWALTGFAPWAWDDGASIWNLGSPLGGIGVILTLALIGGAVYLIVRAARADRSSPASARKASAQPATVASDSGDATVPLAADAAGIVDPAGRAPAGSPTGTQTTDAASAASTDATGTAPYGDDAQVADWRARQEAWRTQDDAWRRSQQDAARIAREQARRERHAHGAAFAVEAEERRRLRRASQPRTSFAFVLTTLGAAIVAGAIAVLTAASGADSDTYPYAGAIGLFTAALVIALGMVVAGAVRRRSGFLSAVTIVLLVIGGSVAAASGPQRLAVGDVNLGTASYAANVIQPFGSTSIWVAPLSQTEDVTAGGVTLTKGIGGTSIEVYPGSVLVLDATLGDGDVVWDRVPFDGGGKSTSGSVETDADGSIDWRLENPDPDASAVTTQRVTLDQRTGPLHITIYEK